MKIWLHLEEVGKYFALVIPSLRNNASHPQPQEIQASMLTVATAAIAVVPLLVGRNAPLVGHPLSEE